ncbi:MAG: MFS transporter [Thermoleophilia bacterium]|nr:MFS transporter [Thermoleophilia bacterium]
MASDPHAAGGTFRALREPNYRRYVLGAFVSNVGTWMARVAQDWLVLVELTDHSANAVGVTTALQFLPMLLLSPVAGVVADRFPKRRVLQWTQLAMLAVSGVQAALILAGVVRLWHVFALAFALGVAAAIDGPARQTFVSELVGPDLVSNAVGLNAASFNASRLVGPGVAGLVIAAAGTGWAFAINSVSFVAFLVALATLDPARLPPRPRAARGRGGIREGVRYVRRRPDLLLLIGIAFMLGTFGMNFQITMALMATTVFHRGPEDYGALGSIMAAGSLAGALLVARMARPRLRLILAALAGFAVFSAAAGLAPSYAAFAALLVPTGLCAMSVMPACNALVQLSVEPEVRGRVMAVYMAVFLGGTPLGSPLMGWIGDAWGARWTLLVGAAATGLTAVVAVAYVMRSARLRLQLQRTRPYLAVRRITHQMPLTHGD